MAFINYHIFKISVSPHDISLKRRIINPFTWVTLISLIMILPLFIILLVIGLYGSDVKILALGGFLSICVLSIIAAILIKWNYYSHYPANVQLLQGNIYARFRRMFNSDETIHITSQDQPFLSVDYSTITLPSKMYDCSQVTLHSMNSHAIIIYSQLHYSKEEAINKSKQFAELISSRTNLFPKEKIHLHN